MKGSASLFCQHRPTSSCCAALARQQKYPFDDPSLPMEKRIDNLLSLMTIDEKIDLPGDKYGRPATGCDELRELRGHSRRGAARNQGQAPADHYDAVSATAGDGRIL